MHSHLTLEQKIAQVQDYHARSVLDHINGKQPKTRAELAQLNLTDLSIENICDDILYLQRSKQMQAEEIKQLQKECLELQRQVRELKENKHD